jgi:hypothetical protein
MPYMADTNIVLRFIFTCDPNHIFVRDAIYSLRLISRWRPYLS